MNVCHSIARKCGIALALFLATLPMASLYAASIGTFTTFESGQVRPIALSQDGSRLFVVNTPDNRLEIFTVNPDGLVHLDSVPVGLEPVSVAQRTETEIWVVNHLSDSISIVTLGENNKVTRTLRVGDEPRDIVFTGPGNNRAFVAAANRDVGRTQLQPGVQNGAADVWVFDADNLGNALFGDPLTIINLFSDSLRALAVSPDGQTVYAAPHHSGNQTTVVSGAVVLDDLLPPLTNADGVEAPRAGLIVKWDGAAWRDFGGRDWTAEVPIRLPDYDLFTIDAAAATPVETGRISGLGTTLFNIATNPVTGKLYVSNTDARNHVRFEGSGLFGGSTVRGHFVDNRITVVDGSSVTPRDLNTHINYALYPGTFEENERSLAMPLQMQVSADGSTLYVAAFSSSKIGIFDTGELENGTFVPDPANHIELAGGGPSGLVLDETNNRMYVLKRFTNSVGIIDVSARAEIDEIAMHNPEPEEITAGRRILYDARYTSQRGNGSCGSCHVFGDVDHLAWDLGDPNGGIVNDPNPMRLILLPQIIDLDFHPMKGPMTTQSFRGMDNHGPMHWRGDRTGGNTVGDPFNEHESFKTFIVAFEGLVGRAEILPAADMQAFADFALTITYPPNPIRAIDNSLTPAQARGEDFYRNFVTETFPSTGQQFTCNTCHVVDVEQGFFGSDGFSVARPGRFGGGSVVKIPHIRNVYTKIGNLEVNTDVASGDQYRGYFINHEGSTTSLMNFLTVGDFDFPGGDDQRRDVTEFVLAVDTDLLPVVGRQVSLYPGSGFLTRNFVGTLATQAAVTTPRPAADLVVKGIVNGEQRGWLWQSDGSYAPDRTGEPNSSEADLFSLAEVEGNGLTFTAVPPGNGVRMALDRDEDGVLDGDDNCVSVANGDQADSDQDGVGSLCDNCTLIGNPDQRDSNGDGYGNVCDADLDNNGAINFSDLAILKEVFFTQDPDADIDGDGSVSFTDLAAMKQAFFSTPGPSALAP